MKRFIFGIVSLAVCLSLTVPCFAWAAEPAYLEGYEEVYISSADDYFKVAENCTSDKWSEDKRVVLKTDIDFTDRKFRPIPLFSGIFDGNGHSLTGISFESDGSSVGVIRWLLGTGTVRDLTVKGPFRPGGTAESIGAVAGKNEGTIENCTFSGDVIADTRTGGIAGLNCAGGKITGCSVSGEVNGFHMTGGICGENLGTVEKCVNSADINTSYRTEVGGTVASSGEDLLGITDAGGIAGFNGGLTCGCENKGTVGYPKSGYRVGGISGSQTGKASECSNSGLVMGRRDVGGIVGKLIPDSSWNRPEDRTDDLETQLGKLKDSINTMIENLKKEQTQAGTDFGKIISSLEKAEKALGSLSGETESWVNANTETLNGILDLCNAFLKGLAPIGESISEFTDILTGVFGDLSDAVRALETASSAAYPAFDDIMSVLDSVTASMKEIEKANSYLKDAFAHLDASFGDPERVAAALQQVAEGYIKLANAIRKISDTLDSVEITPPPEGADVSQAIKALIETLDSIGRAMKEISADFSEASQALGQVSSGMGVLTEEFSTDELKLGLQALRKAMVQLGNLPGIAEKAALHLKDAVKHLKDAGPSFAKAMESLSKAFEGLHDAGSVLKEAVNRTAELSKKLAALSSIHFSELSSGFTKARKNLFAALNELNASLREFSAHLTGSTAAEDLQKVTEELFRTIDCVGNILKNFDISSREDPIFRDISPTEEDHSRHVLGVIVSCINMGIVKGDTYIGGIAGSCESDKKITKDDIPDLSLILQGTAEYSVYASIRQCVSYAPVTAEKNCAGGIAGYAEHGLIEDCISTGEISSKVSYAGGIAGNSRAYVRKCRSRTALSGVSYVGGVCGSGQFISECLALPYIPGEGEYTGAVAGDAGTGVLGNFYADCSHGGVNGFSFSGQAERISYDEITEMDISSSVFKSVTVSFVFENGSIARQDIGYGTAVSHMPDVPDSEGLYWVWDYSGEPVTHDITVKGKYHRPRSAVATDEEKPYFVAEGLFSPDSVITVTDYEPNNVPKKASSLPRIGSYTVTVSKGPESFKVRYLEEKEGILYVIGDGGNLIEEDYERDGSYIVFELRNGGSFLYTGKASSQLPLIFAGVGIGIAFMGIIVLTVVLIKRRKKKKAA